MCAGQHKILWLAGVLLLVFFLGYTFWYDHKENIQNSTEWRNEFVLAGIDPKDMTHDEGMWYYKRRSTCVGYGDWTEECPKHEGYCAGGKTFGNARDQISAIRESLENGGTHPECPLIYAGAG